ncbi:MAG: putative zinc-binding metallopeptidase [Verrucomicrobiae bacterium]|nr:putative zinc-binding metallopeptidase [Verrucomicrobiae bacterium]
MAVVAALVSAGTEAGLQEAVEQELHRIQVETAVRIYYRCESPDFFPAEWLNEEISPQAEPLAIEELWELLPVIRRFLTAYPPELLRMNLSAIYLAARLRFYGKDYGGTCFRSSIYLACPEDAPPEFLLARLHSEFSSVLFRKHPFPKKRWCQLLPPRFQYVGSGTIMLGERNLYAQDSRLLAGGFIVRYAQSSLENDFNMIADWLFTKRAKLDALCRKYPLLRQKRDLAVSFYRAIGCPLPGDPPATTQMAEIATSEAESAPAL